MVRRKRRGMVPAQYALANLQALGLPWNRLPVISAMPGSGRQPGEFYGVHSIATDSKGNIYKTGNYGGQQVQKFVYKGIGPVTKADQGVVWPGKK
jgi:hypothetical protein